MTVLVVLLVLLLLIFFVKILVQASKIQSMQVDLGDLKAYTDWLLHELEVQKGVAQNAEQVALERASEQLQREERRIRKDAAKRSRSVTRGKHLEQVAAVLPGFEWLPAECRFLGSPIDLIAFEGLSEDDGEITVIFIEVKSGSSRLSVRERRVRDAIQNQRVKYRLHRIDLAD